MNLIARIRINCVNKCEHFVSTAAKLLDLNRNAPNWCDIVTGRCLSLARIKIRTKGCIGFCFISVNQFIFVPKEQKLNNYYQTRMHLLLCIILFSSLESRSNCASTARANHAHFDRKKMNVLIKSNLTLHIETKPIHNFWIRRWSVYFVFSNGILLAHLWKGSCFGRFFFPSNKFEKLCQTKDFEFKTEKKRYHAVTLCLAKAYAK